MSSTESDAGKSGSRILQNFSYLTAGKLLADVFLFLFFIAIARIYGEEGVGQYGFALAVTAVIAVLADFGLARLSVKEMSRDLTGIAEYYGHILSVRLLLSLTVLIILLVSVFLLPLSALTVWAILLLGIFHILHTLIYGFGAVFIAKQRMHIVSAFECALVIVASVFGLGVALAGGSLSLALAAFPVMAAVVAILSYRYTVKQYGPLHLSMSLRSMMATLRKALPYASYGIIAEYQTRMPIIMVGIMLGVVAVGALNAATRIVVALMFLPMFTSMAVFPVASKLHVESREQFRELYQTALNIALLIGLPAGAGIWLIAPELIELLYGDEFVRSQRLLLWVAWLVPAIFIKVVMGVFLTASDEQTFVTYSHIIAAGAGTVLLGLFIMVFGLTAAVIVILSMELMLVGLFGWRLRSHFNWRTLGSRAVACLTAILAFVVPFTLWKLPMPVVIAGSVVIYSLVLLSFRDIRRGEYRLLLDRIRDKSAAAELRSDDLLP